MRAAIALGSNVGDSAGRFDEALTMLKSFRCEVLKVSSLWHTPAMGENAGDDFLNAAALIETQLPPQELLQTLHVVEERLGRVRSVHWGPRTIDLDLLFYEDQIIAEETIVVPHPHLWYRRFVLEPLAEVAAEWLHPELGETAARLLERLQHSSRILAIDCSNDLQADVARVTDSLQREFADCRIVLGQTTASHDVVATLRFVGDASPDAVSAATREIRSTAQTADDITNDLRNLLTAICGVCRKQI